MADVLVDTDIFVDHLRGAVELKPGKHRLNYSVITRAELSAATATTDVAARVPAPLREIRQLSLVTRNKKHFDQVRGLRIASLR